MVDSPGKVSQTEHNPYSLVYEFHPRTTDVVVVSTALSTADHPLCGHVELACHSIVGGVGLSGQRKVEIKGEAVVGTAMNMEGEDLVIFGHKKHGTVVFSGKGQIINNDHEDPDYLTISNVTVSVDASTLPSDSAVFQIDAGSMDVSGCSFTSDKAIGFALIRMDGDNLTLSKVVFAASTTADGRLLAMTKGTLDANDVTLDSLSFSSSPILISHATGELKASHFTNCSITTQSSSNSDFEPDSDPLCRWRTGLLALNESSLQITSSTFSFLPSGAIFASNSEISIESTTFHDNTHSTSDFASVRHNVWCEGAGQVQIGSLHGGDGSGSEWMWMEADEECRITMNGSTVTAPFFVPTINTKESKCSQKKEEFTLNLVGSLLVPCALTLNLFEIADSAKDTLSTSNVTIPIQSTQTNESFISLQLPLSSISLNTTFEWRASLLFGHHSRETESVLFKISAKMERKAHALQAMKWIIPVVCSVIGLLILLLVVFLICRRRKQTKTNTQQKLSEQQELNHVDEIEVKVEQFGFGTSDLNNSLIRDNLHANESEITGDTKVNQNMSEQAKQPQDQIVEAINCDNVVVTTQINNRDTLFNRLHRNQNQFTLDRQVLMKKLSRALENIALSDPKSHTLLRFSPHWILFDSMDCVYLQSADTQHEPSRFVADGSLLSKASGGYEEQRWEAPEVAKRKPFIDTGKAAVFSLGLVLWEIETGLVPFGETDAANAQRQLDSGILPPMEKIKDENLALLIERCLILDPSQRATLHDVSDFLWKGGVDGKDQTKEGPVPTNL
ncbi:hypothetical protein BLNAU_15109 [Blattamonas nauphoetae]|uniref:Protein kinase domain-containing protein n=1 Tax=Blattamonas nauphoetae TaxID=2049346 RepID=A0ABQ9XDE9_9EUKA|nr:hypothetical protein BLNAU_15109 [Blattamonas nauphoetae]